MKYGNSFRNSTIFELRQLVMRQLLLRPMVRAKAVRLRKGHRAQPHGARRTKGNHRCCVAQLPTTPVLLNFQPFPCCSTRNQPTRSIEARIHEQNVAVTLRSQRRHNPCDRRQLPYSRKVGVFAFPVLDATNPVVGTTMLPIRPLALPPMPPTTPARTLTQT